MNEGIYRRLMAHEHTLRFSSAHVPKTQRAIT